MSKDSFVFYKDWFVAIRGLDDTTRLELYDSIMNEAFGYEKKDLSPQAFIAMSFIKPQIERDNDKYEAICRRNSENGKKGGRPRKVQETQENPKNPSKPKKADNDIQDTYVSMSISNNIEKKEKSKDEKKKEPTTDLEKQFDEFRKKYKSYGGKVRGFDTEFLNLKNKHHDWKEIIPVLSFALEKENEARVAANNKREFFARMQNLQTYINQRSWEAYSDGWEDYDPNDYHPSGMDYDAEFDAYRMYGLPNYDINDGYTNENRPDGARVVEQQNIYVWHSDIKKFEQI